MRSCLFLLPGLLAVLPGVRAAALTDLGQGLLYGRVHALPADLPDSAAVKKSALVLDLRYAGTDGPGAAAFAAWLGSLPAAEPVFVLVNDGTSPLLLRALSARPQPSGVVTLGPALSGFAPDETLTISSAIERRAYDALAHGASAESLITIKIDKPRYDEAAMVRDHASDSAPGPDEDAAPDLADAAKTPAPPPPLTDQALRRAVQLDRALLALRKIPRD